MGDRVTTVWVKQGHYAHDPKHYKKPDPDIVLERIGDLQDLSEDDFRRGQTDRPATLKREQKA